MRRFLQVVLIAFAASMIILALMRAPDASASVSYTSPYTIDQTYSTALRMLHVDNGFKILEKDKETGFILFEYTSPESGTKPCSGSLELVETKQGVHVSVQITQMPQYHERAMVDQLAKKLLTEYGDPPKREKSDKDKSKDDEGKDKDDEGKDKDKSKDSDGKGKEKDKG